MPKDNCVFCDIVAKREKHFSIYEDNKVMAILVHRPVRPGHTIILTKDHYEYFVDLPDDLAAHIAIIGNRIARKMKDVLDLDPQYPIGHVVHGYIPHVHYHVIPQGDWLDITSAQHASVKDGKVFFTESIIPIATDEDQAAMAERLMI